MDGKTQLGPRDIIFPVPAVLVVTGTLESPNVLAVAWIGMMGSNPPVIGISLDARRYSCKLLSKHGEFTVNIPSSGSYVQTDYCGIRSGRNVDKFRATGFTPVKGAKVGAPVIRECPFNMECVVVNGLAFNGYRAFFGEIVETHIDSDKIDGTNAKDIDISKVDPLVYIATVREYWSIGKKLGDSFSAGKKLDER